jgi:hypothetical protein
MNTFPLCPCIHSLAEDLVSEFEYGDGQHMALFCSSAVSLLLVNRFGSVPDNITTENVYNILPAPWNNINTIDPSSINSTASSFVISYD